MHSRITFLFVCISLAVDLAIALPIPALMRPSQFGASRSSHVTLQEWALICIFISAILFSTIGAFVLTIFARTRASSSTDDFSLGATTRCPFRGLYVFSPSSTTTPGGVRGASRRTRVATRRGVAYPMAAGRRWYQSRRQSPRIPAV